MKWTVRRVWVFQAWDGAEVLKWYVCLDGVPRIGLGTFIDCFNFVREVERLPR